MFAILYGFFFFFFFPILSLLNEVLFYLYIIYFFLSLFSHSLNPCIVLFSSLQATEAACYLSVLRAPKLVLAGDHCQLPPTIVSAEAAAKGLDLSLMERVIG